MAFYFHNKMQFTNFLLLRRNYKRCLVAEDEKISKNCNLGNVIPSIISFTGNGTYDDDLEEFELVQWDIYHRSKRKRCITRHIRGYFLEKELNFLENISIKIQIVKF